MNQRSLILRARLKTKLIFTYKSVNVIHISWHCSHRRWAWNGLIRVLNPIVSLNKDFHMCQFDKPLCRTEVVSMYFHLFKRIQRKYYNINATYIHILLFVDGMCFMSAVENDWSWNRITGRELIMEFPYLKIITLNMLWTSDYWNSILPAWHKVKLEENGMV